MAKIYEYLKEKANNPISQNKVCYAVNNFFETTSIPSKYTFKEVYDIINECIILLKQNGFDKYKDKPVFIPSASIFEDNIMMISLMELGVKPILIQKDSIYVFNKKRNQRKKDDYKFEVAPAIKVGTNHKISIINDYVFRDNDVGYSDNVININCDRIKALIENNYDLTNLNNNNYDFALSTSGTTGKKKIIPLNEDIFIDKIKQKYELYNSELYICQNPICSISGLLFSLYLPIIGNNKSAYSSASFDNAIGSLDYDYVNLITSTIFFEESTTLNRYIPKISDDIVEKINKITLLGSKADHNIYSFLHSIYPSVKDGDIVNFYGRTENYGLISKINENEMNLVYIYHRRLSHNHIIYSYDKEKVYENFYYNGKVITKESRIKYSDYSFTEIPSVANTNNLSINIDIDNGIFGEIIADGLKTGDFGFKLNNNIYLMCREKDLLKKGNIWVHLPSLEDNYNKIIAHLLPNEDVHCYCVPYKNTYKVYITCYCDHLYENNFYNYRFRLDSLFKLLTERIPEENIIMIKKEDIYQGDEMSKFKKYKLSEIKTKYVANSINCKRDINQIFVNEVSRLLMRRIGLRYSEKHDFYCFPKDQFSPLDIAYIINNYRVLRYRESEDNYYLCISDDFMFSNLKKNMKINEKPDIIALENIEKQEMWPYLLERNNLLSQLKLKIGFYYNDDNHFTGVILGRYSVSDNRLVEYPPLNTENYVEKCIEIVERNIIFNSHDFFKNNYFETKEWSIDDDDNLYCDNILCEFKYYTPEINYLMQGILKGQKQLIKEEGKHYAKH